MSFIKNDRTFPPRTRRAGGKPMSFAGAINSQTVAERVSCALRQAVIGLAAPGKQVSRITGRNPRTIRNLMDGSNAPSAATLIELMRDFDDVYIAVLEMAQRHPESPSGDDIQNRIEQAMKILCGENNDEINTDRISPLGRVQKNKGP